MPLSAGSSAHSWSASVFVLRDRADLRHRRRSVMSCNVSRSIQLSDNVFHRPGAYIRSYDIPPFLAAGFLRSIQAKCRWYIATYAGHDRPDYESGSLWRISLCHSDIIGLS